MYQSKIGELIANSKLKREYIQEQLKVSRGTLSNWCIGKTHPSGPELFLLADLLEVNVNQLYHWVEDKEERE